MRLLVVSPDTGLVAPLQPPLAEKGIDLAYAPGLEEGMRLFRRGSVEMVVLDDTTGAVDCHLACQTLRRSRRPAVLVVLTEKPPSAFRAADSLVKPPLTVRKLLHRVRKYLSADNGGILQAGDLVLDVNRRRLVQGDRQHRLTPKECALLSFFMRNVARVLSRKVIMQAVWDTEYVGDTRTLDVHIHWLRKKIEPDARNPRYIRTLRGKGFCFDPAAD